MVRSLSFYVRRAWANLHNEILVLPSRTLAMVWAIGVLALPVVYPDPYILRVAAMTCIFATLAASWDLLAGYAGQVSFGHALFFGAGAYGAALMTLKLEVNPWLGLAAGAVVATLVGLAIGFLCLRLRGSYLSLATLAFPLIATGVLFAFPDFSGGELGVSGLHTIVHSRIANYYIAAVGMLVLVFGMWLIADSKFGIVLHAIRDDEVAARASGINTKRYKLAAFGLSSLAAGVAGGIYAYFMRGAGPSTLETALSFQVVIWGVFGGLATIYGAVTAVFLLYPMTEWLGGFRAFGELRLLIFAIVVLLVLLFMPRGLTPWVRDKIESECPRCKQRNHRWRSRCRICDASLKVSLERATTPRAAARREAG
jgi:branched-chain amino acid transport system permease protein